MSNTNVETVNRGSERIKLGLAVLVVAAGIVGYSVLDGQNSLVRAGVFVASLIVAVLIIWFSDTGRRLVAFFRVAYTEVRRVHWPSPKGSTQMSGIVFVVVAVMAIWLWLIDQGLGWISNGLWLGRKERANLRKRGYVVHVYSGTEKSVHKALV